MAAVWSERETVQAWLDVEAALARSQAEARGGWMPSIWVFVETVAGGGVPNPAIGTVIADTLGARPDGRMHYGATTQDIMDTALSLQLARSMARLGHCWGCSVTRCLERHAGTVMAARTHAEQAVPTPRSARRWRRF